MTLVVVGIGGMSLFGLLAYGQLSLAVISAAIVLLCLWRKWYAAAMILGVGYCSLGFWGELVVLVVSGVKISHLGFLQALWRALPVSLSVFTLGGVMAYLAYTKELSKKS